MRRNIPAWFHTPSLVLARVLLRPLLQVFYRTPLALPVLDFFGRRTELTRTMGERFSGYVPDAHDVLVCSYGKSGTNWTIQIALEIAHLGEAQFDHIHSLVPWPDELAVGYSLPLSDPAPREGSPTGLRVIKTHLPWKCVPHASEARYICVVRDPKDVAVSGYYFFQSVLLGPLMPPMPLWVEHFLSGHTILGNWAEHLHGYWKHRHQENFLFLTYEEMKEDLSRTVDTIARFMGVTLNPEQRERVLRKSSFAYMREIDHKFYPGLVSPFGLPEGKMMRQGESRSSLAMLSLEQRRRIDASCQVALRTLGSGFPYGEVFHLDA